MNDLVLTLLAGVGVVCFATLLVRRYRFFGVHTRMHRRLILVDFVMFAMAVEVLVDTLIDIQPKPANDLLEFIAGLGRGAIILAGVALLTTFPGDQEDG